MFTIVHRLTSIIWSIKTLKGGKKQVVREVKSLFEPISYSVNGIIHYNDDMTGYYLNKKFYKLQTLEDVATLESMCISVN